jgi:superfamily II DNA or RNA helicase
MELRPYQIDDVAELLKHPAYGVFNEQRTGKTPTSIVAMDKKAEGRIVIVCPASMQLVWKTAVLTWTSRPSFVLSGTVAKKHHTLGAWQVSPNGVAIISYDSVKSTKKTNGMFTQLLSVKPMGLIVDEAHRLVGRKTANFNAINNFRHIPHRLYLTGTPAPNHPSQVCSILHMIDHKTFSSYWRFAQ